MIIDPISKYWGRVSVRAGTVIRVAARDDSYIPIAGYGDVRKRVFVELAYSYDIGLVKDGYRPGVVGKEIADAVVNKQEWCSPADAYHKVSKAIGPVYVSRGHRRQGTRQFS